MRIPRTPCEAVTVPLRLSGLRLETRFVQQGDSELVVGFGRQLALLTASLHAAARTATREERSDHSKTEALSTVRPRSQSQEHVYNAVERRERRSGTHHCASTLTTVQTDGYTSQKLSASNVASSKSRKYYQIPPLSDGKPGVVLLVPRGRWSGACHASSGSGSPVSRP